MTAMPATSEYVAFGRCRSGKRWFWIAYALSYTTEGHCDDPVCFAGMSGHEYGWEDTEDLALKAMAHAAGTLGGELSRGANRNNAPGSASAASSALKRINAAKRRARPPKAGADGAAPAEYLYQPWSWSDYDNPPYETHKGINAIPVVKKTAKRIYYNSTSRRDRADGVVTLGYIDRAAFESDTRCRDACSVDVTVTRCSEHHLSYPHCAHVHAFTGRWKAQYEAHRESCPAQCPLDAAPDECGAHGYTWEHCPHGNRLGQCHRGSPPGVAVLPDGNRDSGGGIAYATLEAAEEYLFGWEREQERKQQEAGPELKRLRVEMADAHPDRGGTAEAFIAARKRYEQALARMEGTSR